MSYVKVCPQPRNRNCEWVDTTELFADLATQQVTLDVSNMSLTTALNEPVIETNVFWAFIGFVALMFCTGHIIRQILNLVQWRR